MATGKVVWSCTMSLDGFIAGPRDAMDWVFESAGRASIPEVDEIVRTTGAVLAGRRSYDVGQRARRPEMRKPFGGGWSGAQFVLTHRPPAHDPDNTFLSGDIRGAVATALEAAGGMNVNVIGATVGTQCVAAGLVDEIVVFLAPVLLGDGVPLFRRLDAPAVPLEKLHVSEAGPVTVLRFRVLPRSVPAGVA